MADLRLLTLGHTPSRLGLSQTLQSGRFVLNPELVASLEQKILTVLHRFRLEEAQTLYLRADIQKKNGDYTSALTLFTQALKIEPENLVLLNEKALTEFHLGLYSAYYQSLAALYALVPFQKEWRLALMEGHIKYKAYGKIIEAMSAIPFQRSPREELALAAAFVESGKPESAAPLLRGLSGRTRETIPAFLIQYYTGKTASLLEHPTVAKLHFLRAQRLSRQLPQKNWDPYDLPDKVKATNDWLEKADADSASRDL